MSATEVSQDHVSYDTDISTCKGKRGLLVHTRECNKRHTAPMAEPKKTTNNSAYAETNDASNSATMADMKPGVGTTSQMKGESDADSFNPSIVVRPIVSRKSRPTAHVSTTCISSDPYDFRLRRKPHRNFNPIIIRRHDSRVKKCLECGSEFIGNSMLHLALYHH